MNLSYLGVTPAKEKQLNKKGITSVESLVRFLPRKYNDFSKMTGILPENEMSCIVCSVKDVKYYDSKMPLIRALCVEKNTQEKIYVNWFNQKYLYQRLLTHIGKDVYLVGKAIYNNEYNNYSITSPAVFTTNIQGGMRIYPVYSKIAGMSEEYLVDKMNSALSFAPALEERCPRHVVDENGLMSTKEALNQLHFPDSIVSLERAKNRMIFDDLLYFALRMEYAERKVSKGSQYSVKTLKITNKVINSLPYELTDDQKFAIKDMTERMREGKRINALVQGDVGCGKSIIAFLMMLIAADSGYQAAIMAPTQVLARQHYCELSRLVEPYGLKVAFFGGNKMKAAEKRKLLAEIADGSIQLVVGTHAVLNKEIAFKDLAFTITDEEHKFGVVQRNSLIEKAAAGVHSITMSATPIPRSLAQVVYGNGIQLYTINTMPEGRKPVKTAVSSNQRAVYKFLYREISQGRQAYIVCPMIDKNEDYENVKSVEEVSEQYKKEFADICGYTMATLTGRNTKEETEQIIDDFKCGKTQLLVSTTVIEVGVNVPNASAVVVHNAERFGLSGLHQLRGRVGRGKYQSYCVLFSDDTENQRLSAMVATTDGFKIAEEDLRLRGAGDFIGTKQSGDDKYMALMMSYPERFERAKSIASTLLDTEEDCQLLRDILVDAADIEEIDNDTLC